MSETIALKSCCLRAQLKISYGLEGLQVFYGLDGF